MDKFIPIYQPDLSGNELKYVTDCVKSGWVSSLGKYVGRFEEAFAKFCRVEHAIAVCNGTVAIHLALIVLGIGPGDEVILPTLTFVATANAVRYTGATPVFVDSEPETWTINPELIEEKITVHTKAIIPVHLYGHPAEMSPILELADANRIYVIEDAAEAHGAEYRNRKAGSLGHIGCFSFYGNKVLTTGEGGILTTNDEELARKSRFLKDHGMSKELRYWHPLVGYNYRMTNVAAALGLAQLERVNLILKRKRELAKFYQSRLKDCPGVICQSEAEWAKNIYWMFSILVTEDAPLDRNDLIIALGERGIDSRPFFIPMHQLPPYREENGIYPVADNLSKRGINLPSYPTLDEADIKYICESIYELCTN